MILKKIALLILLVPGVSVAEVTTATGKIERLRAISSSHESAADYDAVFRIESQPSNCSWFNLPLDSDSYMSVLLMSKAQEKTVTVWYDVNSCEARTIEVQ